MRSAASKLVLADAVLVLDEAEVLAALKTVRTRPFGSRSA